MLKGCGKEFVFNREVVKLESENPNEELFEEQNFIATCREPLLCKDCSQNTRSRRVENEK